jgi:hypothetical protein
LRLFEGTVSNLFELIVFLTWSVTTLLFSLSTSRSRRSRSREPSGNEAANTIVQSPTGRTRRRTTSRDNIFGADFVMPPAPRSRRKSKCPLFHFQKCFDFSKAEIRPDSLFLNFRLHSIFLNFCVFLKSPQKAVNETDSKEEEPVVDQEVNQGIVYMYT